MKPLIWLPFSCAAILTFSSCANNKSAANDPLGTGPFDSHGNYREDWADDPTKWRKPGSRQAPADDLPVVAANELPPANATPLAPVDTNSSKPRSSKPGSTPKPSASTAAAEPKTVSAKPKPKSKPKPTSSTYVVKKGDTLSGIASRNGSSVSAIRRANSISGSMIHPGDKLKIPRR